MIPRGITSTHILAAIDMIRAHRVPDDRKSTKYCLIHEGRHFPPKYVISLAAKVMSGTEHPSQQFNGGAEANDFLRARGFTTIPCTCGGLRSSQHKETSMPDSRPLPAATPQHPFNSRTAVASVLLAYATAQEQAHKPGEPIFTPNVDADRLIQSDPFAYLVAVICDQGIRAEIAWSVPHQLLERLGHLDPRRIARQPAEVHAAFQMPPALHRFVNTIPGWIVAAARRVVAEYGGDAGRIWGDQPTAAQLQVRLEEFQGVGQKKAAMAVEILARDLHCPIRGLEGSDIAYDVHVRRVFLRAGLAERDDPGVMIAAARALHPGRPGALDMPAWLIGRGWCYPTTPNCHDCPIAVSCPKHIMRASRVTGA